MCEIIKCLVSDDVIVEKNDRIELQTNSNKIIYGVVTDIRELDIRVIYDSDKVERSILVNNIKQVKVI